jgi:zinc finger FYVE domain-containing protein 26
MLKGFKIYTRLVFRLIFLNSLLFSSYLNAINLQIEVTKFLNNCANIEKLNVKTNLVPTLFGSNDTKINLCCLVLLSGDRIQDGFGSVIRIIQGFNLNTTLVYSQTARELAKQYNFKEMHSLLNCINESGYTEDLTSAYDECISAFIRVFSSGSGDSNTTNANQQYNKELEELIQSIKDEQNKINAYVLTGRLKSAYLIAIKLENKDNVRHIAMVAERLGQNLIKDICNKWLEKYITK